ncbi:MAG: carbon-nitrogen hydrolase family protein [Cellulomonas sp.]
MSAVGARPVPVRVTLGQLRVHADRSANRAAVVEAFDAAAHVHADLLVLPEYTSAYDPRGVGPEHAEPLAGPFVETLRTRAARTGVAVIAGTTLPGASTQRAVNAVVAVDPAGELVGVYRKVHLYDAFGTRESDRLEPGPPGAPPLVVDVGGLRFGVLTCYDLRFPESARRAVDAGADVLVVPAAWAAGDHKELHWRALAVARAIENTCAVVAVGQAGGGLVGRSLVVGPDGMVDLELGTGPQVASIDVDPARIARERDRNPSLRNRRYTTSPVL